jgi:putative hydrolase of the HAD superfamily
MQTIIFDFGNVVGFFDHGLTLRKLTPFTDMTAEEMYREIYDGPLEDEFESGRLDIDDFLTRFRTLCRLRCDRHFISKAVADIFRPNPEICDLIPRLRPKYRLLLGSNTNPIHSERYVAQFADLFAHFDALILSHEVGHRKPAPGFFRHCLTWANCEPGECLFVDDLPANIEGAKAAGLNGIVYFPGDDFAGKLRSCGIEI